MGKTMLITGTTQGIGRSVYDYFYNKNRIYTINRRDFPGNNYLCDLSDLKALESLANILTDLDIDILINNAGGAAPVLFPQMKAEELVSCTNLNYHAPVLLMQAVLPGMRKRGYGRIINISSIASKAPRPYIPHYGASKSALEKFSSSMAVFYGDSGVTINCICPGGVKTETSIENRKRIALMDDRDAVDYNESICSINGLGRMVKPEEIVYMIDYLISDRAEAISGQVINICGVKEVN